MNRSKQVMAACLFTVCGTMLVACGRGEKAELQSYVEQVLARPPGKIDALPTPQAYQPYKYSSSTLRSPFMPPKKNVTADSNKPDDKRPKQELEAFSLDGLHLVGTVGSGPATWALISAPNGSIYRVGKGGYLGRDYGQIEKIGKDRIEIIETVPDGEGGWIRRPTELVLEVKE